MGRAWILAPSLMRLREQLAVLAPHRSTASDGSIGDTNHLAEGWQASDHNPWWPTEGEPGVVRAIDITHDPAGGMDCNKLADALVAARDPRVLYIIWCSRIVDSRAIPRGRVLHAPWTWLPYDGSNPHDHHLHVSVVASPACRDTRSWSLAMSVVPPETQEGVMSLLNFRVTGDGILPIGCPTGPTAGVVIKEAWVSAFVEGPGSGKVRFWFQNDRGGIKDVSRDIPFSDGHSARVWEQVPAGTTMIRVEHHFPQSGTVFMEYKPQT